MIPPSPLVMFFSSWKLKQPTSPSVPTRRPLYRLPHDWAASSITFRLWARAKATIASISAATPPRWTGMIALVRLLSTRGRSLGSICIDSSTSAKTGRARLATIAPTDAIKVTAGTIPSSPGPTPRPGQAEPPRRRPAAHRHGVARPDELRERRLEGRDLVERARAVVAEERLAVENLQHRLLLGVVDRRGALVAIQLARDHGRAA